MKTFHFSIRLIIKNTYLPAISLPSSGLYTCHWLEDGSCNFDNTTSAYQDMIAKLAKYYDMSYNPTIMYHVEESGTEVPITDDVSFAAILEHAARSYSMFSLSISVRAPLIHDFSSSSNSFRTTSSVNFGQVWRESKPKFHCMRDWLLSLEKSGETLPAPDQLSYGEKAMLFANFTPNLASSRLVQDKVSEYQFLTNQTRRLPESTQSQMVFEILSTQIDTYPDFIDLTEEMLHEKMILDPAISMILFNEYIPLQRREPAKVADKVETLSQDIKELSIKMTEGGVFIKSDGAPPANQNKNNSDSAGLFLRSASPSAAVADDWVIA